MNIKNCKRYTDDDIVEEANLYLKHKSMRTVSTALNMPIATVGWHLKHKLETIEPILYKAISNIAHENLKCKK